MLVVHSKGDEEIPFQLTNDFVTARPNVVLVETAASPHRWEADVDPEGFQSALSSWLENSASNAVRR